MNLSKTFILYIKKENHGLGEETCGCQGGGGGSGMDWELGVNRCRLLPLERISNEILLGSAGSCLVIYGRDDNGRKKNVYMYVQLGPMLYSRKKNNVLGK